MADMDDPPPGLKDAFTGLEQAISPDDYYTFQSTALLDILKAAEMIPHHHRRRRALRNMARLAPLLRSVKKYSKAVEVMCNGTPYLLLIWAPVSLILKFASTHSEAFVKLLEAYSQIAEVLPLLDQLSEDSKDDPNIQQALAMICGDVLEFHRWSYKLFHRRAWHVFFGSLWKDFEGRFHGILRSVEKYRDVIDKEASSMALHEAKTWKVRHQQEIERQEIERQVTCLQTCISWLSVQDHAQADDLDRLLQNRQPYACDWIFGDDLLISWIGRPEASLVLWMTGPPGAGKSVLTAHMIKTWQSGKDMNPIYYFCHRNTRDGGSTSLILRTLIAQMLRLQPELSSHVIKNYLRQGHPPCLAQTRKLLLQLVSSTLQTHIILDGLDECDENDQSVIISELMTLVKSTDTKCQLLVSSRQTTHLSQCLKECPIISIPGNHFSIIESQADTTAIDAREHAAIPMRRLRPNPSKPTTGRGQTRDPSSSQERNQLTLGQSSTSGNENTAITASVTTSPHPDSSSLTCQMCTTIYFLWFALVTSSLAIGFWRSFATGDEGKGFTDAAYVVAVGGLIVYPIQTRHYQRCELAAVHRR